MSPMTDIRQSALRTAAATGLLLAAGGALHAAAPPSGAAPEAVPVSPTESAAKELSAPPLLPGDAEARAGHKLPCGLSYYENPSAGKYKVVVYTIGNCHDQTVSRAVNFDPDQPEPRSACTQIPAHYTVIGAWGIGRDQHVSRRGTGMVACH